MAGEKIKIFQVEDDTGIIELIYDVLSVCEDPGYEIDGATSLGAALEMLDNDQVKYDIILTDLSLPDSKGLETFSKIHFLCPDTPIIIMSGRDDENMALEAVSIGAQDYLVKGRMDGRLLERSIKYAIERYQLKKEIKDLQTVFLRELKMPIKGIKNNIQSLLKDENGALSDKKTEFVENIQNLTDQIENSVNKFVGFSDVKL